MKLSKRSKNKVRVAKGQIKQGAGEALGDERLAEEGRDDQVKGHLQQAAEKVKDAFTD